MSHTVSLLEKDVPKNVSHFSLDGYPCFIQINYQILENRDVVSHVHFSSCLSFQITVNIWRINSFFKLNVSAVSLTTALNKRDIAKDNAKKPETVLITRSFWMLYVDNNRQYITHYTILHVPDCHLLAYLLKSAYRYTGGHSCFTELVNSSSHWKIFLWLTRKLRPCMREGKTLSPIHESEK